MLNTAKFHGGGHTLIDLSIHFDLEAGIEMKTLTLRTRPRPTLRGRFGHSASTYVYISGLFSPPISLGSDPQHKETFVE